MNKGDDAHKKPRNDSRYNVDEMKSILPYKEIFIKATSRAERLTIFQNQILPAMFNHWLGTGKRPKDDDESREWAKASGGISSTARWIDVY